jgi:molybdopterin/thiamine biosynthesis adenylyltransferase
VAVVGLGGIGGTAFELLARAGVGKFILIDKDRFELSNLNRQILSSTKSLGKRKAEIAVAKGKEINPEVKIKAYSLEFNEKNTNMLKDADIVVDGLDNPISRIILNRAARKYGIPYIFGAAEYMKGISTVFMPWGKGYEDIFARSAKGKALDPGLKAKLSSYRACQSVLGPVPNIIGCFEAMQAINLILGKRVVKYPEFMHVDMNEKKQIWIGRI